MLYIMGYLDFIWDENKNRKNIASHNISFEEAKTVFYDPNARVVYDPEHSDDEARFIILGLSRSLNLLVVCHCYREDENIIRIISARKATLKERKQYGGNL
jgi:uncharacterized DUF497 family protein